MGSRQSYTTPLEFRDLNYGPNTSAAGNQEEIPSPNKEFEKLPSIRERNFSPLPHYYYHSVPNIYVSSPLPGPYENPPPNPYAIPTPSETCIPSPSNGGSSLSHEKFDENDDNKSTNESNDAAFNWIPWFCNKNKKTFFVCLMSKATFLEKIYYLSYVLFIVYKNIVK